MKLKLFSFLTIVTVLVSVLSVTTVAQAGAYGTSFTTSITYQNIGTGSATIHVDFYAQNSSTPIPIDLAALPALAGSSLYVGSLSQISAGFSGSAVMSSDQPLAVTLVANPAAGSGVIGRPLSNGMSSGSTFVMIPTVLKNTFGAHTVFSVQNASSANINATVDFIPTSGTTVTKDITNLPPGAGQYFDLGTMADWTTFNGSVQINATGAVVASAQEAQITGVKAYAFEGTAAGGATVYMPSALCGFGASGQTSSYAVQNTNPAGGADVSVVVTYKSTAGTVYTEAPVVIAAGKKASFAGCGVAAGSVTPPIPSGFIGSATIAATGGNIVAIAKIYDNNLGTAFLGFTDAPAKVALPYVRWADNNDWFTLSRQRTYIAIQNIGAAELAAGSVTVTYYDKNGAVVGAPFALPNALPVGAKGNSNPTDAGVTRFGYYPDNTAGGSAVIQGPAGSKLAVIARVVSYAGGSATAGEDYNGIPMP